MFLNTPTHSLYLWSHRSSNVEQVEHDCQERTALALQVISVTEKDFSIVNQTTVPLIYSKDSSKSQHTSVQVSGGWGTVIIEIYIWP